MICPYCGILFDEGGRGRGRGRRRTQCGSDPCKRAYWAEYKRLNYLPKNALRRHAAAPGESTEWRDERFAELDAMIAEQKEREARLHEQKQS